MGSDTQSNVMVQLLVSYYVKQPIATNADVQTVCKFKLVVVWICYHALILQIAVPQRSGHA